ncbi:MAG: xanthine dehydrogenase accessory protein XdhC [Paracoccaceae bacterium]
MFDLAGLGSALAAHGRVARIVIAAFEGHSPREVGAAMLVWAGGQSGTIGGGALEFQAVARAREMLGPGGSRMDRDALGPALGQCCGGVVTLLTEVYDAVPEGPVVARGPGQMPLAVSRILAAARGQGASPEPGLVQGWMVEPITVPLRPVWVWGAGHVGRALVGVLAPLTGLEITWVDFAADRFPAIAAVRILPVPEPERAVTLAPPDAEHLIVTFSHALDLELCHRLLQHGFGRCGLIGSATKWARFRSRLGALGHSTAEIGRIECPIGDPALGKHPQAIAIGVAAAMLRTRAAVPQQALG